MQHDHCDNTKCCAFSYVLLSKNSTIAADPRRPIPTLVYSIYLTWLQYYPKFQYAKLVKAIHMDAI